MTALKESHVMNGPRSLIVSSVVLAAIAVLGSACYKDDPCGAGLIEVPGTNNCMVAPAPQPDAAAAGDGGGGDGGGDGGAPAESSFGKACTSPSECGPEAPLCNPQLPYCTQQLCKDGQVNAGVCPAGFTCTEYTGYPSFCMKN